MDRRILAGGLALFVVVAAILWIPWATKSRTVIASTPVPPPVFGVTPAPLKGGGTACMSLVTYDPHTQIGEIAVTTRNPGPPLAITARAAGWKSTARIAAGYKGETALRFDLKPPSRSLVGQLCIRNTGKQAISLNSTNEPRTNGRPELTVDGAREPMDPQLAFYAKKRQSYLARIGAIFAHAAIFTPPFLTKALLIVLGLLALVGIPVAVMAALALAARDESR